MAIPNIETAVPLRRYLYGEFLLTVLGDIESADPVHYRYILAVATEADPTPGLFVSAERDGGGYALRVSMADGSQVVGSSAQFGELERFTREAMAIVSTMLDLGDEVHHPLS